MNPFTPSTTVKTKYALIQEAGSSTKLYLSAAEVDSVFLARQMKEQFVHLQGREYPTRMVRLMDINQEDRSPEVIKWTEHGPQGEQFVDGEMRTVYLFKQKQNPGINEKVVDQYLGYFVPQTGRIVRLTQPA